MAAVHMLCFSSVSAISSLQNLNKFWNLHWPCRVQVGSELEVHFRPAHDTATDIEWQLSEVVLTQFVSPNDEHDVLETRRELKI